MIFYKSLLLFIYNSSVRLFFIIFKKQKFYSKRINFLNSCFCGKNLVGKDTIVENSEFGFASYVAHDSYISRLLVGKFSSIGPFVKIIEGKHPASIFVSTHPAFYDNGCRNYYFTYADKNYFEATSSEKFKVFLGNDVWVGAGVIILEGVEIGDGAIIAAGATVTCNVPSYEVWGGIPAKKIKDRFPQEIKDKLIALKWWNLPEDKIKQNFKRFHDAFTY